jgi:ArsR family transcriptional regulator
MSNLLADHQGAIANVAVGSLRTREGTPRMTAAAAQDMVKLFKLLSDETRLRILSELTHEPELHVRALCDLLQQSQPAVSHHLGLLRDAGLIERRREGKHNFYHLVPHGFAEFLTLAMSSVAKARPQHRFEDFVPSD